MVETRNTDEETGSAEGAPSPEAGEAPVDTNSRAMSDFSDEEEDDEDNGENYSLGSIFSRIEDAFLGEYSNSDSDDSDDNRHGDADAVRDVGSPYLWFWKMLIFVFSVCLVFQVSITMVLLRLLFFSSTLRAQNDALLSDYRKADYMLGVVGQSSLSKTLFPLMRMLNIQPGPVLLVIVLHFYSPAMVSQVQAPGNLTEGYTDFRAESRFYLRNQPGAVDQPFWSEAEGGSLNISEELYRYLMNATGADERVFLKEALLGLDETLNAERLAQNPDREKPALKFTEGTQNVTVRLPEEEPPDKQKRSYKE